MPRSSSTPCWSRPAILRCSFLPLILIHLAGSFPVVAQMQSGAADQKLPIEFTVTVPPAPAEMQIFKLEPTKPPIDFLNEKLRLLKIPELKLEEKTYIARGTTGQEERDRVRSFVDTINGDAHLTPNFAELVRSELAEKPLTLKRAQTVASSVFNDERFIPRDATRLRAGEPITVMGGATTYAPAGKAPAEGQMRREPRVVLTIH